VPLIRRASLVGDAREIDVAVDTVLSASPGRMEYRYLEQIHSRGVPTCLAARVSCVREDKVPLLLTCLPQYPDIEATKMLALLIGSSLGAVVAYADYNGSYLSDIRVMEQSRQASARPELLRMHNDFPFAADGARPSYIVLVPHLVEDPVPKTLLAPGAEVVARLSPGTVTLLRQPYFEAHSGARLVAVNERVERVVVLAGDDASPILRFHFDGTIRVAPGVPPDVRSACARALDELFATALSVGFEFGHAARKSECLIIPNDHCSHGREALGPQQRERLLLRAYVVERAVAARAGTTMLRLAG
jgi:hypothetical protein